VLDSYEDVSSRCAAGVGIMNTAPDTCPVCQTAADLCQTPRRATVPTPIPP